MARPRIEQVMVSWIREGIAMEAPEEMLARHVREGEERLAQQQALVAFLERRGHTGILDKARRLLREMLAYQNQAENHLADWQARHRKETNKALL
jgi:hypothetical protein